MDFVLLIIKPASRKEQRTMSELSLVNSKEDSVPHPSSIKTTIFTPLKRHSFTKGRNSLVKI